MEKNNGSQENNIILEESNSPQLKRNQSETKYRGVQMKQSSIQQAQFMRKNSHSKLQTDKASKFESQSSIIL